MILNFEARNCRDYSDENFLISQNYYIFKLSWHFLIIFARILL